MALIRVLPESRRKPEIICPRIGVDLGVGEEFSISLNNENRKFGWLQGLRKRLTEKKLWLRRPDLNRRRLKSPRAPAHEAAALLHCNHPLGRRPRCPAATDQAHGDGRFRVSDPTEVLMKAVGILVCVGPCDTSSQNAANH